MEVNNGFIDFLLTGSIFDDSFIYQNVRWESNMQLGFFINIDLYFV
jgi:hypothetical protein